jgi:hypothetical protein
MVVCGLEFAGELLLNEEKLRVWIPLLDELDVPRSSYIVDKGRDIAAACICEDPTPLIGGEHQVNLV